MRTGRWMLPNWIFVRHNDNIYRDTLSQKIKMYGLYSDLIGWIQNCLFDSLLIGSSGGRVLSWLEVCDQWCFLRICFGTRVVCDTYTQLGCKCRCIG